ncbi:efflux RND transporter permease subunit [Shewanella surugensis]|uniref:Efflux RND transporter permease subunit n=1 Tax=Shewanella surugensis TaxID=212020 RepID=A0ABT0L895_9GAMM|nr:efflux RND transporter permease subunit [Shewanella surugensis]MCL1123774.1 efflux RND transporter permease subunit [Shewanella surugensis]
MNIGEYSVHNKVISWLFIIVLLGGGIIAFNQMGKLEDPEFTIKLAKVITLYPGATAQEVQDEVTYYIEDAVQKLPQVKWIKMSVSRPGLSDITIEFKDKYRKKDFPNIFDELRRKIADVTPSLPSGASAPMVIDDFGDVYGVYGILTGKGYSWRDLWDTADKVKKQMVQVPGVRKIVIDGEQKEVVYVEISRSNLGELGISLHSIASILASQNEVIDAGGIRVGDDYLRISPTGTFQSVQSIGDVLISSKDKRLIYLKDIATITRAYNDVPNKLYYVNGEPGLAIGISMLPGENVVKVGKRLAQRFQELKSIIPLGMGFKLIYNQPQEVDKSVSGFIVSVGQAVAIVIVVLLLFMGMRVGLIIGSVLLITVAGTLFFMDLFAIDLQRISLGALVIALGMLVDNAIVVAEGMMVRMQRGMKAAEAAAQTVGSTIWALLGGTAIGILAFSAIGLSPDSTGEFAGSLFYVIFISLSLSWLTAVSTTPLLCALLMKQGDESASESDPYKGLFFTVYRKLVCTAIHYRWVTVGSVVVLFVIAVMGFSYVKSGFFPESNTPMFFIDVWEPEGSDILNTRDTALKISQYLDNLPGVLQTSTVIGGAHQRFTLVYDSKEPAPAYAQIIVQTESREMIPEVWQQVEDYMRANTLSNDPIIKALRIGPGRDGKIEARFSGPDASVLRELSVRAQAIMRSDNEARDIRDDWRNPVKVITPVFNEQVGRQLGITREDLALALQYSSEGNTVGAYRDSHRSLPIKLRAIDDERGDVASLRDVQIWSPVLGKTIPASQVVSEYQTRWENTVLRGRNRIQTIIASCNPKGEFTEPLFERLKLKIDAMTLPPGYHLSWGGEYEDSQKAQAGLAGALPVGFLLMILTSILLFGKLRQPLIIWLTVPLAIIGITAGLLATGGAFDFMSILGALSLVGLLIKNAIVLIDEIDQQIAMGKQGFDAIVDSSMSRLRPVVLAAATTILGMIPLLPDVFFVNMSITIMAGLGFATFLTMLVVPTLYAIFFRIKAINE